MKKHEGEKKNERKKEKSSSEQECKQKKENENKRENILYHDMKNLERTIEWRKWRRT